MDKFQDETNSKLEYIIGGLVFLVSIIVYILTVQRTIPLWDCGEFIACSYTLGVAHPPGTPLFLLIGRIFTILPIAADISHRMNLLSVLSGASAATCGYFVAVKILKMLPKVTKEKFLLISAYICSATGALLFAFSHTNWSNSVEAEVYSLSMLLIFMLIWISLKWYEVRGTAIAQKYLVLISYLGILSIGIHMTVFLVMPVIFLFVILVDNKLRSDFRFWISAVILFMVAVNISWFFIGVTIWGLISLALYITSRNRQWLMALLISFSAIAGFSVHGYIPIRASHDPAINQNNPETYQSFKGYIARDQYGNKSMYEKMLTPRAFRSHQFGDFPRIGLGGFLIKQYGMSGMIFIIPLILVLLALITLIKWKWKLGVFLLLLLIVCTIGLAFYMNFADGSIIDPGSGNDKLEVRDRDYFFTPGFILFGLLIGMGCFSLLYLLANKIKIICSSTLVVSLSLLTLIMPLTALLANYNSCDRSQNRVAYDFAYNLLMSCPDDAILFTNGDNDTFPVWCLQEVYGIRKDVKVVNLSLIQTDWYQLQMKHQLGVPISLEDDQMVWQNVWDDQYNMYVNRPVKPYVDHVRGGVQHYLFPFADSKGQFVTVAHQMIEIIINDNRWKYPIVFGGPMPKQVGLPLYDHYRRSGIIYEITKEESKGEFDVEKTLHLLENVYRFENLRDPKNYRGEVATSLIIGQWQRLSDIISSLSFDGDTTTAIRIIDNLIKNVPEFWLPYEKKADLYSADSLYVDSLYAGYLDHLNKLIKHNPDNLYYYQFRAFLYQIRGSMELAIVDAKTAYDLNPSISQTYRTLVSFYFATQQFDKGLAISREFLKTNPYDQTALSIVRNNYGQ